MPETIYSNNFIYAAVLPAEGSDAVIWCAGVNLDRFNRITRGRHGQSSNPVVRGLQRVRMEVIAMALDHKAAVRSIKGGACADLAPASADTWYAERLGIESSSGLSNAALVSFTIMAFLEKIALSGLFAIDAPGSLPGPAELQRLLEGLCADR